MWKKKQEGCRGEGGRGGRGRGEEGGEGKEGAECGGEGEGNVVAAEASQQLSQQEEDEVEDKSAQMRTNQRTKQDKSGQIREQIRTSLWTDQEKSADKSTDPATDQSRASIMIPAVSLFPAACVPCALRTPADSPGDTLGIEREFTGNPQETVDDGTISPLSLRLSVGASSADLTPPGGFRV
jgi:hypothetical protein